MSDERFVVLGLAHVRSTWFRDVARWSSSASVPLDFIKCVSVEELQGRLRSGRAFSAIVVDAGLAGIDRDLIDEARTIGCSVLAVTSGSDRRDLLALGASATLPEIFDRAELLAALDEHATRIGSFTSTSVSAPSEPLASPPWRGRLLAVTGAGGTGTSVLSMALAQGLAADARTQGRVLLADLALDADQAMLHDARDIVPGVQELVEAHRHGHPSNDDILRLTFGDQHPYRLLLGLRRHRDWTVLRSRAWWAALDGLQRTFTQVVADIDPDVEGEDACGSSDVEDRNLLARSTTVRADLVVVTSHGGIQGLHRLVRIVDALIEQGVTADRILPVVNRAPRSRQARAGIADAYLTLTMAASRASGVAVVSPVFIGEHRRLDRALHDGIGVPAAMAQLITDAVNAVEERATTPRRLSGTETEPVAVTPGSLGSWATSQEATG